MSTQKVTDKILHDAENRAQEILTEYKNEAEKIAADYNQRIEQKKQHINQQIEERKETEIMRGLSQHRLALNRKQTEHKQHLITTTIEAATSKLNDHGEYLAFLKAMIEKSGEKKGDLLLNKDDLKRYRADLEKFLSEEKLELNMVEDDNIRGGVVIKRGTTSYIGSLDIILELLSEDLAIAISKSTF
jgi:vacuolar-type H+-ATPase subunit E/Vma4